MGDKLKHVHAGVPMRISAATFNTMIDATRDSLERAQNVYRHSSPMGRRNGIVPVKNATDSDQDRFAVLGIDGPIFTPTENEDFFLDRVTFSGVVPTEADHQGKFVILLEPIREGDVGMGCAGGVCPAKINIVDVDDESADVTDGDSTYLTSGAAGSARILWREAGTGTKWAIIAFRGGGLPSGGLKYQVLSKKSDDDGDVHWDWVRVHA